MQKLLKQKHPLVLEDVFMSLAGQTVLGKNYLLFLREAAFFLAGFLFGAAFFTVFLFLVAI